MLTPLPLSHNDRTRLTRHQTERFKELDIELFSTAVSLDGMGTLHIHCFNPAFVDSLTEKQQTLAVEAHAIFGAGQLALWSRGDEVWQINTQTLPEGCDLPNLTLDQLESVATDVLEALMATATLERNSAAASESTELATTTTLSGALPYQKLQSIAEDVEQPAESVREWLVNQGMFIAPFNGEEIVRGEDAIAAYSHFEPLVIQARMAKRGLIAPQTQNGKTAESAAEKKTRRSTARKPAAKKTSTRAKRSTAAKS